MKISSQPAASCNERFLTGVIYMIQDAFARLALRALDEGSSHLGCLHGKRMGRDRIGVCGVEVELWRLGKELGVSHSEFFVEESNKCKS